MGLFFGVIHILVLTFLKFKRIIRIIANVIRVVNHLNSYKYFHSLLNICFHYLFLLRRIENYFCLTLRFMT